MVRRLIKRAGDNADVRGSVALLDLFNYFAQYILPVIPGVYVFWKWGTDFMFGPIVAILTALIALLAIRIAIDPDAGPRVWRWVLSRFGIASEEASAPPVSSAPTEVPAAITPSTAAGHSGDAAIARGLARLHYLTNEVSHLNELFAKADGMEGEIAAFLNTKPGIEGYRTDPHQWSRVEEWNFLLSDINDTLTQTLGIKSPDISVRGYTPSQQPSPTELALSKDDANSYWRFYEQVRRLKSEGISLLTRLENHAATARHEINIAGQAAYTDWSTRRSA